MAAHPPEASDHGAASRAVVDRFIDALWIEDGLAKLSLQAYRRDLMLLVAWLTEQGTASVLHASEADVLGYIASRHHQTRATTANRRLTVFKRFYRWALREHLLQSDPTLKLLAARQPMRSPKSLTEAQVEALLARPMSKHP